MQPSRIIPKEFSTWYSQRITSRAGTIQLAAGSTKNDEARVAKMTSTVRALLSALASGKKPNERLFTREAAAKMESRLVPNRLQTPEPSPEKSDEGRKLLN